MSDKSPDPARAYARPEIPADEQERLAHLEGLNALFTPAQARFDEITQAAKEALEVPISLLTLVGRDLQWFKSAQGLSVPETPREISFCGHAIHGDGLFMVHDARADPRFRDNPLVTGPPHIRFYAGFPLRTWSGSAVGTLCVIDRKPRDPSEAQLAELRRLGRQAEQELRSDGLATRELELLAENGGDDLRDLLDPVARCWNSLAFTLMMDRSLVRASADGREIGVLFCRARSLAERAWSDEDHHALRLQLANRMRRVAGGGLLGMMSEYGFGLMLPDLGLEALQAKAREISECCNGLNLRASGVSVDARMMVRGVHFRASHRISAASVYSELRRLQREVPPDSDAMVFPYRRL